jgi:indole-3-glycerol phosphate synthase
MTHILDQIVETKRAELQRLLPERKQLESAARNASPPRAFREALGDGGDVAVMAEVKRRSPGAGPICPELSPVELAGMYQAGGARAMSVLTDGTYFGGDLTDLIAVRDTVALPVLRKDFILHPVQIYEARAVGADGILLIVRILSDAELVSLRELAQALGMGVLVEAHDAEEVDRALSTGADILGVNNRDLATFHTTLDVTLGLLDRLPSDVVVVSESGIRTASDVERLGASGVDAVLVGESLLRQKDPEAGVRALCGHAKHTHG